jgi:hypothetical protein
MPDDTTVKALRQRVYEQQVAVNRLRWKLHEQSSGNDVTVLLAELATAEEQLRTSESELGQAETEDPRSNGAILGIARTTLLGAETTQLEAKASLRMAQVPTSVYHLLDARDHALVSGEVRNVDSKTRRLRVTSFLEEYSARAVSTFELPKDQTQAFSHLPTLFPERLAGVSELTRATLNVLVEDLDGRVELHATEPVWLLPRTTAVLSVTDPTTGMKQDLTPYLAAYVTPNAPCVMQFLRSVAEYHPQKMLVGYQGDESAVTPQVKAIFDALKTHGIAYVNSVISFSAEEGAAAQRIRLPRQSLAERQANCIDGTVLVASLLEAMSLSASIVLVPGHAFVAWETWKGSDSWRFLETTLIGSASFADSCDRAEQTAATYKSKAAETQDPYYFRFHSVRTLRAQRRIIPME